MDTKPLHSANKLVFDFFLKQAILQVVVAVPFLGLPVVNQIFTWVVGLVANQLFVVLDQFIVFSAIDFEIESQNTAYKAALANLKKAQQGGADAKELEKADAEFDAALGRLIRMSKH